MSRNTRGSLRMSNDMTSNSNDLFRSYTPSLYEEMFDGKDLSELLSDPLLSTTSNENGNENGTNNGNGTLPNTATSSSTTASVANNELWTNSASAYPATSNVFNDTNTDQNALNEFFELGPLTSGQRDPTYVQQPQITNVQPQLSNLIQQSTQPSNVQPDTVMTNAVWPTASASSISNSARIAPTQASIKVKTEPQETVFNVIPEHHSPQKYYFSRSPSGESASSLSRGALYAREYRRKNKTRVSQLEVNNERLWRENQTLKQSYDEARSKIQALEREVIYLRQVLANDTTIAKLMDAVVANTPGLKFQFPLASNTKSKSGEVRQSNDSGGGSGDGMTRKGADQVVAVSKGTRNQTNQKKDDSPGICFHVNGDLVSMEFCPRCNRDAKRGAGDQR